MRRIVPERLESKYVTGWVGIVWSRENVLMNTLFPSDHLESLVFLRDYS